MEKGFGTVYEKSILDQLFTTLLEEYPIHTVCEFPANDLMGNNSEQFEALGCEVTRQSLGNADPASFDLVWCFCEVEQQDDPSWLLARMIAKSKRYLFIVTQNRRNLGVLLHYLHHRLVDRNWNHGHVQYMTLSLIETVFEPKVSILQKGAFDVPWFILDVYEDGQILQQLVPEPFIRTSDIKPSVFETLSFSLKRWFSHHLYVLGEKQGAN
jgi:hypothetical protein